MTDETNPDDDSVIDIEPRSAATVAQRAIIVSAAYQRVLLEIGAPAGDADEANEDRFDLASWLRAEGLWEHATRGEQHLLSSEIGALDAFEVENASWLSEAVIVLAWSLDLIEVIGSYGEAGDPRQALAALPAPWDKTAVMIRSTTLRPLDALALERERAELWHWRAAVALELERAPQSDHQELIAVVAEVASEAYAASLLPQPTEGDFPVGVHPYRNVGHEAIDELASMAAERYRTLNWICGFGTTWDDVPTDT